MIDGDRIGQPAQRQDVYELMPDEIDEIEDRAQEIARQFLERLPEKSASRVLTRPEEIHGILACKQEMIAIDRGTTVFSATDALGNLPAQILSILDTQGVTPELRAYIESFAENPVAHANDFHKVMRLEGLPRDIEGLVKEMILCTGNHSLKDAFLELNEKLNSQSELNQDSFLDSVRGVKAEYKAFGFDQDKVRARALEIFLDTLYPFIANNPLTTHLQGLWVNSIEPQEFQAIASELSEHYPDLPQSPEWKGELSRSDGIVARMDLRIALEKYAPKRLFLAQSMILLQRQSDELEKSKNALNHWISEVSPRHAIGNIVASILFPILTSDLFLSKGVYGELMEKYQVLQGSIPKGSEDEHMNEKLECAADSAQELIRTCLNALERARITN